MLALASIACAVTLFPHVRTARRNRDAAAFWAGVAALGTDDPADGVARLERLARAHGTTYEARRAALSHLSIAMLTLGLHRRARPLVASLEHAELSRHTLEHYKQASMLIHVALGDLESARAARARLTERVPPYHDALFAAREGRWEDAVTMARVSYDEARAYHDDPSVLRWPAAILAFALARSGRKGKELRASLRAARGAPHPMAVAIPEWPELREFVEHHVDRPGAGSTP